MKSIRVIQVGVGPIGQRVVRYAIERDGVEVIGAVDPDPAMRGKDLGPVCGLGDEVGVAIAPLLDAAMNAVTPHVAVLTTTSSLERAAPQIEELLSYKLPVVSTCEELSHPWATAPALAERIDRAARAAGVAVLGTGVNPGFLMDALPIFLTAVCQEVTAVKVARRQDATFRRVPFQRKIGAGLTLAEFEDKKKAGTLRHVGLTESIRMIAGALGWTLDKTEDVLTPVVADRKIDSGFRPIEPGMAAGVRQIGRGWRGGQVVIELEFVATVAQPEPADEVEIVGTPSLRSVIPGGVNGDVATCAITINALRSILTAPPGLRTMADMPMVSYFGGLARE